MKKLCLRLFETAAPTGENNEAASDAGEKQESKDEAFEKLIKGDYKEAFAARTQGIIDKRFKEYKTLEAQFGKLEPILAHLSQQHNVGSGDVDGLIAAILDAGDNETIQEEAKLEGVKHKEEVAADALQSPVLRGAQEVYGGWLEEAEALRQIYPQFSLTEERENPQFINLLRGGASVRDAYEVVHKDEVLGSAIRYTAQQVSQQVATGIANRASRPQENGSSHATAVLKNSPASMTKSEREAIARRVMRGEMIRF